MNDLREQIAEIIGQCIIDKVGSGISTEIWENAADDIIALIPKPTVRVKCDKCGGSTWIFEDWDAGIAKGSKQKKCPSCTDGWNEHLINWSREWTEDCPDSFDVSSIPAGATITDAQYITVLTLPDLIDPDVAQAYGHLMHTQYNKWVSVLNNKGTLRIGEKV